MPIRILIEGDTANVPEDALEQMCRGISLWMAKHIKPEEQVTVRVVRPTDAEFVEEWDFDKQERWGTGASR